MRTHVITGGTDGIGKAVAHHYLDSGHEVVVVGRSAKKGKAWLDAARQRGAAGRAHFIHADLSLTTETRAAIDRVRSSFSTVDTLVLCARHFRTTRLVTAEGFENTFAHFYLSRFLLSHGLADLLEAAAAPVILNVAGPGSGAHIHWEDLQLARAQIEVIRRSAQPVEEAMKPILELLDDPPTAPLSAYVQGEPLSPHGPGFTVEEARRLHQHTQELLAASAARTTRG